MKQTLLTKNLMELLNQSQSTFATAQKKSALDIFSHIPMPKEKDEDWRYTNIDKLDLRKFLPFEGKAKIFATRLSEDLIEKGVILTDINTAFEKFQISQNYFSKNLNIKNDKFNALNLSFFIFKFLEK